MLWLEDVMPGEFKVSPKKKKLLHDCVYMEGLEWENHRTALVVTKSCGGGERWEGMFKRSRESYWALKNLFCN